MIFFFLVLEFVSIIFVIFYSIFVNDIDSGLDVEFDCWVSGFFLLKIIWIKDGKEIKKCYKSYLCEKI